MTRDEARAAVERYVGGNSERARYVRELFYQYTDRGGALR